MSRVVKTRKWEEVTKRLGEGTLNSVVRDGISEDVTSELRPKRFEKSG